MGNNVNIKKYIIRFVILFVFIVVACLIKFGIDMAIVNNEMKTAEHAITNSNDVHMYSSAKEKKKFDAINIGTNTYILKSVKDKAGMDWYKVKIGDKVGYVKSKDISKYSSNYNKKDIMLDVSKFNMQNNFSSINEFKAFVINNDIKFVYIRAGGRGYGQAGNFYTDPDADKYAEACNFLKIPFGYYFLEEAITSEEVDEEVNFINKYLEEHSYEYNVLPIALDIEKHVETGRADGIWNTRYKLVDELIEKIEANNKRAILYSNADLANEYLSTTNAKMWLAYYPNITRIPDYWYSDTDEDGSRNKELISKMIGWQFTQSGVKDEINKKVDISLVYSNFMLNGSMEDIENDIKENNEMVFGPINDIRNK